MSAWPQWTHLHPSTRSRRDEEPAPRIIDCGADIGLASLYYKQTAIQRAVTAIEADPNARP